jgi:hypothetical protein
MVKRSACRGVEVCSRNGPWLLWCSRCCYRFHFRAALHLPASVEARLHRHRGVFAPTPASSLTFTITFHDSCVRGFSLYQAPINKKHLYCLPKITDSDRITLDYCERCARSTRLCGKVKMLYSLMTLHGLQSLFCELGNGKKQGQSKSKSRRKLPRCATPLLSRRFHA